MEKSSGSGFGRQRDVDSSTIPARLRRSQLRPSVLPAAHLASVSCSFDRFNEVSDVSPFSHELDCVSQLQILFFESYIPLSSHSVRRLTNDSACSWFIRSIFGNVGSFSNSPPTQSRCILCLSKRALIHVTKVLEDSS